MGRVGVQVVRSMGSCVGLGRCFEDFCFVFLFNFEKRTLWVRSFEQQEKHTWDILGKDPGCQASNTALLLSFMDPESCSGGGAYTLQY